MFLTGCLLCVFAMLTGFHTSRCLKMYNAQDIGLLDSIKSASNIGLTQLIVGCVLIFISVFQ